MTRRSLFFITLLVFAPCFFFGLGVRKGFFAGNWIETPKAVLTEDPAFLSFCKQAASSKEVFATFKRNPLFTVYYENTTPVDAALSLGLIKERSPHLLTRNLLDRLRKIDRVGGPHLHSFQGVGTFSPETIANLKIASDLYTQFGDLKGTRVIEIGGGAGSLCKVLCEVFAIEHYTIIDLPETLEVARKQLSSLGLDRIQLMTADDLQVKESDLLISRYGFSQASSWVQRQYLSKLLSHAKKGYLVCAFYPKELQIRPIPRKKLLKKVFRMHPSAEQLAEEPRTGDNNFTLVWGGKGA